MRRATVVAAALAALVALGAAPAQATFPGKNGRIVFQRPIGKQVDLFTVWANGDRLHRLTRTRTWEEQAEWSADGGRLAYARSAPSGSPTEIWTMNADGTEPRAATSFGSASLAPTWSPDGLIAYFSLRDFPPPKSDQDPPPPAELYSMAADGSGQRRLTDDRTIQTDPEWSPDGSLIAYSKWCPVPRQPGVFDLGLSVMKPDGTGVHPVLPCNGKRDIVTASWSPDGRRIVYEIATPVPDGREPGSRQSDIGVVNADGTGLRRLTRTAALETHPVWSPDGRRIAFTADRHARGKHLERLGPAFELYTMRADGHGVRRITHNRVPDLRPDWQAVR